MNDSTPQSLLCNLCNNSIRLGATARTTAFGEHPHGGQQMVMSLLNNLGVVRRDDTGSKEVFQEVPSCCSALAKALALSIISAEPLMTGDPLHDDFSSF